MLRVELSAGYWTDWKRWDKLSAEAFCHHLHLEPCQCRKYVLTCVRRKEAAGGADALAQCLRFGLGRRVQGHGEEVVEVDGMRLTLDQAGQAAARRLQALLLQDLADAGVHACIPEGPSY